MTRRLGGCAPPPDPPAPRPGDTSPVGERCLGCHEVSFPAADSGVVTTVPRRAVGLLGLPRKAVRAPAPSRSCSISPGKQGVSLTPGPDPVTAPRGATCRTSCGVPATVSPSCHTLGPLLLRGAQKLLDAEQVHGRRAENISLLTESPRRRDRMVSGFDPNSMLSDGPAGAGLSLAPAPVPVGVAEHIPAEAEAVLPSPLPSPSPRGHGALPAAATTPSFC